MKITIELLDLLQMLNDEQTLTLQLTEEGRTVEKYNISNIDIDEMKKLYNAEVTD